jgi:hypothetical protein
MDISDFLPQSGKKSLTFMPQRVIFSIEQIAASRQDRNRENQRSGSPDKED